MLCYIHEHLLPPFPLWSSHPQIVFSVSNTSKQTHPSIILDVRQNHCHILHLHDHPQASRGNKLQVISTLFPTKYCPLHDIGPFRVWRFFLRKHQQKWNIKWGGTLDTPYLPCQQIEIRSSFSKPQWPSPRVLPQGRMALYEKRTILQVIDRLFYMGQAGLIERLQKKVHPWWYTRFAQ